MEVYGISIDSQLRGCDLLPFMEKSTKLTITTQLQHLELQKRTVSSADITDNNLVLLPSKCVDVPNDYIWQY